MRARRATVRFLAAISTTVLMVAAPQAATGAGIGCPGSPAASDPPAPVVDGLHVITLSTADHRGWGFECSPVGATTNLDGSIAEISNRFHVTVEDTGADDKTNFARIRRKLPEQDGFRIDSRLKATLEFFIPVGFYAAMDTGPDAPPASIDPHQVRYLRVITADNNPGTAGAFNEWRLGVTLEGANDDPLAVRPHLFSAVQNDPSNPPPLWVGSRRLPEGHSYTLTIDIVLSRSKAPWSISISDGQSGSGEAVTIPKVVPSMNQELTRINTGIDGAYNQIDRPVSLDIAQLEVRAK